MSRAVAIVAALLSLPLPAAAAGVRTFGDLAVGEHADVEYTATTDGRVVRFALAVEEPGYVNVETAPGKRIVVLSEGLVPKLDRLLAYYRSPRTGQCARTETVTVLWRSQGDVVQKESFVDRSCGAEETCGVLPLPVIAARANGATPPPSREAEVCGPADLAAWNVGQVRSAVEALNAPAGSGRLLGLLLVGWQAATLLAACVPLVFGWLLGRRGAGLLGFVATLASFAVLAPLVDPRSPFAVAAGSTLVILLLARSAKVVRAA
jgi:hypothetical protein